MQPAHSSSSICYMDDGERNCGLDVLTFNISLVPHCSLVSGRKIKRQPESHAKQNAASFLIHSGFYGVCDCKSVSRWKRKRPKRAPHSSCDAAETQYIISLYIGECNKKYLLNAQSTKEITLINLYLGAFCSGESKDKEIS